MVADKNNTKCSCNVLLYKYADERIENNWCSTSYSFRYKSFKPASNASYDGYYFDYEDEKNSSFHQINHNTIPRVTIGSPETKSTVVIDIPKTESAVNIEIPKTESAVNIEIPGTESAVIIEIPETESAEPIIVGVEASPEPTVEYETKSIGGAKDGSNSKDYDLESEKITETLKAAVSFVDQADEKPAEEAISEKIENLANVAHIGGQNFPTSLPPVPPPMPSIEQLANKTPKKTMKNTIWEKIQKEEECGNLIDPDMLKKVATEYKSGDRRSTGRIWKS